jgi:hypothetical protein
MVYAKIAEKREKMCLTHDVQLSTSALSYQLRYILYKKTFDDSNVSKAYLTAQFLQQKKRVHLHNKNNSESHRSLF